MSDQRFVLPCKCVVMLDHDRGDRLVTCAGDDPLRADRRCVGGRRYVVTAELVETVLYDVKPFRGAVK